MRFARIITRSRKEDIAVSIMSHNTGRFEAVLCEFANQFSLGVVQVQIHEAVHLA